MIPPTALVSSVGAVRFSIAQDTGIDTRLNPRTPELLWGTGEETLLLVVSVRTMLPAVTAVTARHTLPSQATELGGTACGVRASLNSNQ